MKKKPSTATSCLVLAGILLCLLALAVSSLVVFVPIQAERSFGPASLEITSLQHIYLSAMLLWQSNDLVRPADAAGAERGFTVNPGESAATVAQRLEIDGFIPSAPALLDFLAYSGLDRTLQAGDYQLSPAMTPLQIVRSMQDATPNQVNFRIFAGWRLEEIAAALPTSGLEIDPADFINAASLPPDGYAFLEDLPSLASLEGFLFPGIYRLERATTVSELVAILLAQFEQQVSKDLQQGFKRQGLSLYQAVILASIVEREAVVDAEMPAIASVYINRLAAGMKLDADPTVQYAIGYNESQGTWWTNPLTLENLAVESPYNTYLNTGLPPGPIASPGLAALQAVAYPQETPYFYFRAACDGSGKHNFAVTFDEHVANACP